MKTIRVVDEKGDESQVMLENAAMEVTIGRSGRNDLVLSDKRVSRRHAIVKVMGGRAFLVNQSGNGTYVDGNRIDGVRELRTGELVNIGPYRLAVLDDVEPRVWSENNRAEATKLGPLSRDEAGDVNSASGPQDEEIRVNILGEKAPTYREEFREEIVRFKATLHETLKERLDLHSFEITDYDSPHVMRMVSGHIRELLRERRSKIPSTATPEQIFKEMVDQVCGLGPLEDLVKHDGVTEIMVVDRDHIYCELKGKLVLTDRFFDDERAIRTVIERIVVPRGRRIDEATPLVDTRLADGSRVNAIIPPLALKDPCLTIRKFPDKPLSIDDLVEFGSLSDEMAKFLCRAVAARKNIVICGGTGAGKTTLLNVLSSFIGRTERVVTIEDAAELKIHQQHVIALETRPPNLEGRGEIAIRDLLRNALRMRPDRIIVGECRGGEALDMLQAMNTGHDGSMTTVHANSPIEAISRLETLALMSGMDLPTAAIRQQIAHSVDLIVQQKRFTDGSRRITHICEVVGRGDDGFVRVEDIYRFRQSGIDESAAIKGHHGATGYLPSFIGEFLVLGLASAEDFF